MKTNKRNVEMMTEKPKQTNLNLMVYLQQNESN